MITHPARHICRTCHERPVPPSRVRAGRYICCRCFHRSPGGQARLARYNASAARKAVNKRHNDRRIMIGADYHSAARTVDDATPQDITGWALSYRLKRRPEDADIEAVLTKTTSAGITLTTPASGLCDVAIDDTDTDALPARSYYHELKRTDAGSEAVLVVGTVVVQQAIHRA